MEMVAKFQPYTVKIRFAAANVAKISHSLVLSPAFQPPIAAVASLLGFGRLADVAATGAQILIGIVLILFLLVIVGVIALASAIAPRSLRITGNFRLVPPYRRQQQETFDRWHARRPLPG